MNKRWKTNPQDHLNEFKKQTNRFINDFETIVDEFERKGDVQKASSKIKESVEKFQEED